MKYFCKGGAVSFNSNPRPCKLWLRRLQSILVKTTLNAFFWAILHLAIFCLFTTGAHAWSLHYLVTDKAFLHPSMNFLDQQVVVEPFEVFLKKESVGLNILFGEYNQWVSKRRPTRFKQSVFDTKLPTEATFLKAARLHPSTRFPMVNRLLPGHKALHKLLNSQDILQPRELKDLLFYDFEDAATGSLPARSIVSTFSDEPDWGMDADLWEIKDYGYGVIPYGKKGSVSTQGPFHTLFAHENFFIKLLAPEVQDGMADDRVELFSRLSIFAFKSGHLYWGYRFAAWAIHYIEDLGQPYHSKALPFAGFSYYLKFLFSIEKDRLKRDATQLVINRHFAYEDFVAYGLQQSYLEKSDFLQRLSASLYQGDGTFADLKTASQIVQQVNTAAAKHAKAIDAAIVAAFNSRITEDPTYDLETDPQYKIKDLLNSLTAEKANTILNEAGKDFENTGRGARTLLQLIRMQSL